MRLTRAPPHYNPPEIETPDTLLNLTKELIHRGYREDDVRKILGLNWLRVFRDVWGGVTPYSGAAPWDPRRLRRDSDVTALMVRFLSASLQCSGCFPLVRANPKAIRPPDSEMISPRNSEKWSHPDSEMTPPPLARVFCWCEVFDGGEEGTGCLRRDWGCGVPARC
ncbi:membrane dipeptidase [Sinorhizobium medicae]